MSVKAKRRPGRPLLGTEPLSARLTVLVTPSMFRRIEARARGHVGEFVRGVLKRAIGAGAGAGRSRWGGLGRGRGKGKRRIHR